ncbi:MAG: VWA domain-containing protein [Halieaceae bacterium]|jgi:uncharacterized protein with von Willebrand factor type A (vWA) domain|nr:VWA domain-containing protein [Halieaceae bacterium]
MQSSLLRFIEILRSHDLPVSPAETLDAAAALEAVGYDSRGTMRNALALTLAKSARELQTFHYCFDKFFDQHASDFRIDDRAQNASGDTAAAKETPASESADQAAGDSSGGGGGGGPSPADDAAMLAAAAKDSPALARLLEGDLLPALLENQRGSLSTALRSAAQAEGVNDIRLFTQKGQYTRRILDRLGEGGLREAVAELEKRESPALDVLRRYRDVLREQVRDHVERAYLLNAEGHNERFMAEILAETRLSNIDRRHQDRVREQVQRMARRLARRHSARRRPVKRGQLDMAKTLRGGAATDGVLFRTRWRSRKRKRSQLMALCDVSGSVAAYAGFLLMFLYSLQDVLPRTRSFAFSSHLGEISDLFRDEDVGRAIELANWRYGGATDYGGSLRDFARIALDDIDRNTSVIILGDARNNRGDPEIEIMQSIFQRSRQVIWLNPESRQAWGTGDSEMPRYATACHYTATCGNLKQLERVVDQLLKSLR